VWAEASAQRENVGVAAGVAKSIGAELACSRPIAEGVGWLPKSRYLGVSGAVIQPDLYLALGISGQVQHMVGVNGATTMVAINKDKTAPIFAHCDLGLVADLSAVLRTLATSWPNQFSAGAAGARVLPLPSGFANSARRRLNLLSHSNILQTRQRSALLARRKTKTWTSSERYRFGGPLSPTRRRRAPRDAANLHQG
jgi:Electron transfer flavoprotein FAD-binding domain